MSAAGTLYSSLAHAPRSIILQRSEQNGRNGLSVHVEGLRQRGQAKLVGLGLLGVFVGVVMWQALIQIKDDAGKALHLCRLHR